ncbi:MAG: stage V sporulation protein AD [Christensenellales bacterium]|jgi:stage V sporulation protein AD
MKIGKQTYLIDKPVYIVGNFSIVGPKEGEGSFGKYFGLVLNNDLWGEKSFEKCEIKMHRETILRAIYSSGLNENQIDAVMGGDLLNQIIATNFAAKDIDSIYLGIYGACSTFGEALGLASLLIATEQMKTITCSTSSHFSSAERQYRFPLELGNQRTPTAQWTVTGAGCSVLSAEPRAEQPKVKITAVTFGKVTDYGIDDENNMGAAMAPAAASTLIAHFKELDRSPAYYDAIWTGDLGKFGAGLLNYIMSSDNLPLSDTHHDAGAEYYRANQHPVQGGSGAGCSSTVFNSYLIDKLRKREIKRLLLCPTGALLSKDTPLQGATVPAIAHAVAIEAED